MPELSGTEGSDKLWRDLRPVCLHYWLQHPGGSTLQVERREPGAVVVAVAEPPWHRARRAPIPPPDGGIDDLAIPWRNLLHSMGIVRYKAQAGGREDVFHANHSG